jgi:cytochrome c oxidase assembly protein subunit 11
MTPTIRTALIGAAIAVGMTGVGFASVPLYRLFCQVTGFGGTTQMRVGGEAPGAVDGKNISIRFDGNVATSMPWDFKPEVRRETVSIGERDIAFYTAKNLSNKPVKGTATFNVSPSQAGQYFSKIQCFCFTEQVLQPGEEVRMPVTFYVDPKILNDPTAKQIEEITLSYTFFPVDEGKKPS